MTEPTAVTPTTATGAVRAKFPQFFANAIRGARWLGHYELLEQYAVGGDPSQETYEGAERDLYVDSLADFFCFLIGAAGEEVLAEVIESARNHAEAEARGLL